jgi:aryl-alcohol dehydrogenase-like predicted oxidoreductase
MREYSSRDETVLATKIYWPMYEGPGGGGLSRKAIVDQVDASLTASTSGPRCTG